MIRYTLMIHHNGTHHVNPKYEQEQYFKILSEKNLKKFSDKMLIQLYYVLCACLCSYLLCDAPTNIFFNEPMSIS